MKRKNQKPRKSKTSNNKNSKNTSKAVLDLRKPTKAYTKLKVAELSNEHPSGTENETILIVEWVKPDWSERPLLKKDYPNMGYVEYFDPGS